MSAIITMPTALDESIRACCADAVSQAVAALAAKYGFDAEEAERELNLGELKLQRKRGPATKKSVTKTAKATRGAEDETPKTKRALTGYLLFSRDMRAEVTAALVEQLEEGERLMSKSVVTELAAQWKALSPQEQSEWKTRAAAASSPEEEEE
jgi:hypothetical protein